MNEALVASHSCTFELRMNNEQRTMNNELFASLPLCLLPLCLVALLPILPNVQECDATGFNSSNAARSIKYLLFYKAVFINKIISV